MIVSQKKRKEMGRLFQQVQKEAREDPEIGPIYEAIQKLHWTKRLDLLGLLCGYCLGQFPCVDASCNDVRQGMAKLDARKHK